MKTFPNNANGDVFRRMQASGDQLDKPRDIEFNQVFENEDNAKRFMESVKQLGYERTSCHFFEKKKMWDACVVVFMLPAYDEVTRVELKLAAVAREFLGRSDGWGCLAVT